MTTNKTEADIKKESNELFNAKLTEISVNYITPKLSQ